MSDLAHYRRTRKGEQEVVARQHNLSNELRGLLILINGRRDIPALAALAPFLNASLEPLQILEDYGFIEMTLDQPPSATSPAMAFSAAPVAPRPMATRPTMPESAPESRPAQIDRVGGALIARRAQLMQHLASVLGPDYEPVAKRLNAVKDLAELTGLEPKLVEVIKLYRGAREAGLFADKFKISS